MIKFTKKQTKCSQIHVVDLIGEIFPCQSDAELIEDDSWFANRICQYVCLGIRYSILFTNCYLSMHIKLDCLYIHRPPIPNRIGSILPFDDFVIVPFLIGALETNHIQECLLYVAQSPIYQQTEERPA